MTKPDLEHVVETGTCLQQDCLDVAECLPLCESVSFLSDCHELQEEGAKSTDSAVGDIAFGNLH